MVTVKEYAKAVMTHGTTAIIMDPHEIANVLGLEGIGMIHSLQYENTRIPVAVVQTGDNADTVNALILAGGSILLIAAIAYRMKRKKDE